jgi:hypothetical protein
MTLAGIVIALSQGKHCIVFSAGENKTCHQAGQC